MGRADSPAPWPQASSCQDNGTTVRWRVCAAHPHPEYMVEGAVTMPLDGQVVLACGPLPGGEAKRFRMGAAVVLGQNVAEAARPVGHGLAADLAACHRKMGHG